ncbi:hypothetical protein M433DRAFT_57946 [Acidomyces richmondensis BFW]|nr:MAG: hypothetical protein FE78DRAFT_144931 [Acidomyces sp. 'richmondensis']KYG50051.1 hypothetical protein M433DRAFT_57946 [Acidomyces richmondensis BFW]
MAPKRGAKRKKTVLQNAQGDLNGDANHDLSPPDRETWPGWVEMESEPAFFNAMLKDMGVRGVKVHEVYSLEDNELAVLPQPVHALIFLFRYRETEKSDNEPGTCPKHVWFANQTPDFACATFALLNIINNIPGLHLGEQLSKFKEFTQDMDPLSRGDAIDTFDFVRRIHNSFARESDLLQADMHLKAKADRPRQDPDKGAAEADAEDEVGFHFVAYMPIQGHVWMLDGLDRFPLDMGSFSENDGGSWMNVAQPALMGRMAQYAASEIQFNLMAIVHDPVMIQREELAINMQALQIIDKKLDCLQANWRAIDGAGTPSKITIDSALDLGVTAADVQAAKVKKDILDVIENDADISKLIKLRKDMIRNQASVRAAVYDSLSSARSDDEKVRHRRHDYETFVRSWLNALAEQGILSTLLEDP